jgi:hypothetical protein
VTRTEFHGLTRIKYLDEALAYFGSRGAFQFPPGSSSNFHVVDNVTKAVIGQPPCWIMISHQAPCFGRIAIIGTAADPAHLLSCQSIA